METSSGGPKRVWTRSPSQLRGQQRANAKRGLRGWLDRTSRRLGERETIELAQLILEERMKEGRSYWINVIPSDNVAQD